MKIITEEIPRHCCTDQLLKQIRALDFKTDGYVHSLEQILKSRGFGLPEEELIIKQITEEDGSKSDDVTRNYHFMVNYKWICIYLNYADALAEEIILLNKLELL